MAAFQIDDQTIRHSAIRPYNGERSRMRIIGLAGWSGSGKTTLLTKVIPRLSARGKRVSTLKHAHHAFDVDRPGKDSFEHRSAGATEVLVVSGNRWALMHELRGAPEPELPALLAKLSNVDLVLVEGFKREPFPKLEIYRAENGKSLLHPDDPWIVAIASDTPLPEAGISVVDLNDIDAIADLLLAKAIPINEVKASNAFSSEVDTGSRKENASL